MKGNRSVSVVAIRDTRHSRQGDRTYTAAVPIEGTADFELIGATEGVATAKAEVLEPPTEGETGRGRDKAPRDDTTKRPHGPDGRVSVSTSDYGTGRE
jgi:hypothetical protein